MKRNTLILIFIILLAVLLRFWALGSVPISPDWDETALGYNAYSIIQTGRDEYGKLLPVVLRSFDDYKPALYTYLAVPTVYLFGLSVFAVRLPSAIFGILAVLATFYLVRTLFKRDDLALVSALLLAISPWHLQFSRVAFEANVGDALNIFAALFFIKGLKKPWFLTLCAICAAFSLYAYQSEKVFTPLLVILLIVIYFKDLIKINKKMILLACIAGLIISLPMVNAVLTDNSVLTRAKGTSIFQDQFHLLKDQVTILGHEVASGDRLGELFDNRRVTYMKVIMAGYLIHFNPNWLLSGDIPRQHVPDMGLIYLWELPFILIGIYSLLFHKFDKKTKFFIFGWFLLAPLPAAASIDLPHAVRTLNYLPVWQIFSAVGLVSVYTLITKSSINRVFKMSIVVGFLIFAGFNFIYYLNQYFVQQNYFFASAWQYGYEQAVSSVQNLNGKYRQIIVSDQTPMDQSYMFFLFYLKYPPLLYQQNAVKGSSDLATYRKFDKYVFRKINWVKEEKRTDILYIGSPKDFPSTVKPFHVIINPDGTPAIYLVNG